MGSLADQDSAVHDFMEILEEHRKNCERLGKYVEAEIARCVGSHCVMFAPPLRRRRALATLVI
jgi:hypothetical protein